MEDRQPRIFAGLLVLVLVWVGVYWMWEPGDPKASLRISYAADPAPTDPAKPQPDPQPTPRDPAPATQPRPKPNDRTGVAAPEFRTHVVREGELLQDIAERYYNDRAMWSTVAQANPFVDPRRLREGMRLRIPIDPTNIQGRPVTQGEPDTTPSDPPQDLTIEYIVQPNDALSIIAQKHYGSSRYANLIFEANRDTLRSPDAIRVGQVLRLPPLESLINEDAED